MKILNFLVIAVLAVTLSSCNNDDDADMTPYEDNFDMTANLNGSTYTFNKNSLSEPRHSIEEYVFLPGWTVNYDSGGAYNIHLYINRNNLTPGTYTVDTTDPEAEVFIYFDNNSNQEEEITLNGTLTITNIDPGANHIDGTFAFQTSPDPESESPTINYNIQNGTFFCKYE